MVCVAPINPMQPFQQMTEATMKNPYMSAWLSMANTTMNTTRGHMMAEMQRQQMQMMQEWQRAWLRMWFPWVKQRK